MTTTRGRQLKLTIDGNNMAPITTAEPTYWPSDPNKIPDLLDFFVIKGLSRHNFKAESCYDSSSDHTPVLLTMSTMLIEMSIPERLYNYRTDWQSFRDYMEEHIHLKVTLKTPEDIDGAAKYITMLIQNACWLSTPAFDHRKEHLNYPLEIKTQWYKNDDCVEFGIKADLERIKQILTEHVKI